MSILKMSEATSIAIHTVILCARNKNHLMSSKEISSILGVSEGHLSKVLQILVKAEILESERGPKGGFILIKDDKRLKLLDIYKIMEGYNNHKHCSQKLDICKDTCITERIEKPIYDQFLKIYGETSIHQIVNK